VVGAGGNADMMLRSLTSVAATLAGVGNRVGSIKAGMDADFVLWSGHPVNLASSVQAVYVDGKLAFSQKKKDGQAQ
jgi:imidazolonepropionase-like amidohydrolase